MRLVPLITAILVLVSLYLIVMERDALLAFAGAAPAEVQPEDPTEDAPPLRVTVQRIDEREIESAVILRGRTSAARQVEVRSETSGLVVSPPIARGSSVQAGDMLCELAPGTRAASLTEAEARLAEAEINYNAASRLSEGGFAAQTRVASADAARQAAMAGVEAARAELDRLNIRAPFDGLLEADTAEQGTLLSPGGLCATLIRLDPIILVGFASEMQIDRLSLGVLAGARLSNGEEVMGRVSFLARSADPSTRTFRVEVTVPNNDQSIREGMSADIMISATATRGHLVPGSALTLDNEGRLGLRLVDDENRTFFAPVSVLRDSPQGFWVSGLPDPADVVVVGQEYATDGITVLVHHRNAGE
ncbi:MAG: efflux RND transporter periplasmic adaptor subunit [Pararhodobacter sp.]|nr:efflux RND transporter periplasmic adaptor subunit [Pararhodobacter sp.]